jgi:hypothetical protein
MNPGIVKGATGTFSATPIPPDGVIQGVPTWASDDTLVILTPSADGLSVTVDVHAADPATSLNLTVSGLSANGTAISGTLNVPLANPVATGFLIQQTS